MPAPADVKLDQLQMSRW